MKEYTAKITSAALHNRRRVWVRGPRDPEAPAALIIVLDGEFYRDRVKAVPILDRLQRQRRDANAWVVFVSMHSFAARSRECPCHRPFARFIAAELLPWLERRHPSVRGATARILVGLSYTGLAAAYAAITYPALFDAVISQSGSFWWKSCWLPRRYASHWRPARTVFHLDVGRRETEEKVRHSNGAYQRVSQIEGVRRFRDVLKARGHSVRYAEFVGGHDFDRWARMLPAALRWVFRPARQGQIRCKELGIPAARADVTR